MRKDLSVVIVSYNTKDLTLQCIHKLLSSLSKGSISYEVIIIDNNSQDGSWQEIEKIASSHQDIKAIRNLSNSGFGKANNQGLSRANGRYVLYLNTDVFVPDKPFFDSLIKQIDSNVLIGALTVRVQLATGSIDPASHRGFPTVWRSFCYYAGLEKITSTIPVLNRIFGGYHLTHLSLNKKHEIDSPTGAFFLARKDVLDVLGGFDEIFFMYGEDIDLAFRIKRLGYSIIYDPTYTVLHLKNQSGIKRNNDTLIQKKTRTYFYDSMALFYKKHYEKIYPRWVSALVHIAINQKKNAL